MWFVTTVAPFLVLTIASQVAYCRQNLSLQHQQQAQQILDDSGVKGGLIVHIGCGDGKLTAALRANDRYLVHGLDEDPQNVEKARQYIQSLGPRSLQIYGTVSVDQLRDNSPLRGKLPYIDNLVNLVVSENLGTVSMQEVMRVLCPNGVAYIKNEWHGLPAHEDTAKMAVPQKGWTKTVKPWPQEMDEWTHYLHGPDGNPVANDSLVGPPARLQWVGSPRWARHHDHIASMTSLVSAQGRLFYIFDEGLTASIQLPARWRLIARDAFNGTELWKRDIDQWNTHQYPLKSGPAHLLRRLVAVGDRVYVTLGIDEPATALDAVTGKTVQTYQGSEHTREIVVSDGVVFLVADKSRSRLPDWQRKDTYVWDNSRRANPEWGWHGDSRKIMAYKADSGRLLWQVEFPVAPCSMAVDPAPAAGAGVVFHNGEKLICLDRRKGTTLWQSEPAPTKIPVHTNTGPRVLIYEGVVLFAGNDGKMSGWSAQDGKKLWEQKHKPSGHQSLKDLLVVDGLVWTGAVASSSNDGVFIGYDPFTGQKKREFPPDVHVHWFHHRCYPCKATGKYLLAARNGTEFVDLKAEHWKPHHWCGVAAFMG